MKNQEHYQGALSRAASGVTMSNYPAIFAGFTEMGIPESEIKPRENVFTYNAWKALGRQVRKGQHGVKVLTFIDVTKEDKETGEKNTHRRPWHTTVFHISQTEPDKPNGQPTTAPQVMPETVEPNEESVAAPQGFKIEDPLSGQTIGSF
jgi:hypothetical protein